MCKVKALPIFQHNLPLHAYTFPINVTTCFCLQRKLHYFGVEARTCTANFSSTLFSNLFSFAKILSWAQKLKIWPGQIRKKIRRLMVVTKNRTFSALCWVSNVLLTGENACFQSMLWHMGSGSKWWTYFLSQVKVVRNNVFIKRKNYKKLILFQSAVLKRTAHLKKFRNVSKPSIMTKQLCWNIGRGANSQYFDSYNISQVIVFGFGKVYLFTLLNTPRILYYCSWSNLVFFK